MRMGWALIVEECLGRLVITQSLSQLNTPRPLLQHCVSWLSPSRDTNVGLSWQLAISRYQTITPRSPEERCSSWAGAGLAASHAERCPERGCVLVFPSHSSSPCILQSCPKNCQCVDVTLLFQKFGKVLGTLRNLKSLQEVKRMMWGTGRWEALPAHSVRVTPR